MEDKVASELLTSPASDAALSQATQADLGENVTPAMPKSDPKPLVQHKPCGIWHSGKLKPCPAMLVRASLLIACQHLLSATRALTRDDSMRQGEHDDAMS